MQTQQEILTVLHSRIWDKRNKRFGWRPTPGQVKVGMALFAHNKKRIFIQCGRKWGKTEFVIYTLLRWAVLNPDSSCAYFGPTRNDARKIIWRRLKTFIPKEFLMEGSVERAFKEQTLTVRLWNGSEITVDGTLDEDAGRGVEPHIVVYDEYKDHKDGFRESMEANLEVYNAVEMFIGTPPDHQNHFTVMAEEIKNDPDGFFIEAPSVEGPVYSTESGKQKLQKLKDKYTKLGDLSFYYREYEGKFVRGGKGTIFPMFNKDKHTVSEDNLRELMFKDRHKLQWYSITDPGSTTCHATLLAALNPFNSTWYVLEEIYETNPQETTTRRIWPRVEANVNKWYPELPISDPRLYKGYDEAAAWFRLEVQDSYGDIGLTPTNKKLSDKGNGISLIKDQMLEGKILINENCKWFIWEIEQYVKDKNGNIPKENDHLIDVMRYLNSAAGYRFDPEQESRSDIFSDRGWRGAGPNSDDWDINNVFDDYEP